MNDQASAETGAENAARRPREGQDLRLSIVVPVYNEEETLIEFHRRLAVVLDGLPYDAEIVYVDDGSRDTSLAILQSLRRDDPRVALVRLSRNFGKEAALTAGLDYADGDATIFIDADLQDPPEVIPELIAPWAEGRADVVNAQRRSRAGESWFKRTSAHTFYRLMEHVGRAPMPRDVGDFRLLSQEVVRDLKRLREQHRFMKGLFAWVGFRQVTIPYDRDPRYAGETKWNYFKLWAFSIEGITSFTTAPLKVATYAGLVVAVLALMFGLEIIYETLVFGTNVPGYPSLMVVVLFLGGVQLMTMGILGEYIARISDEAKGRPIYLVQEHHPAENAPAHGAAPGAAGPPLPERMPKTAARKAPAKKPPAKKPTRKPSPRTPGKSTGKSTGKSAGAP